MTQPSPDARAVVRALDALTTQVRRVADALTTGVATTDDDATTPCPTPLTHNWGCGCPTDASAVNTARGTSWVPDLPGAAEQRARVQEWAQEAARDAGRPAADEDAQRTARRDSLRILLDRARDGKLISAHEGDRLRQHVETEMREADTARAVAAGNRWHARRKQPATDQK